MREHLAGLGELRITKMFGAGAVYKDALLFALIDDDVLWLRADAENEPALREAGSIQFTYPMKGQQMPMAYWSLPDTAADDPDEASAWARASIEAAARKAAAKAGPKKKQKT